MAAVALGRNGAPFGSLQESALASLRRFVAVAHHEGASEDLILEAVVAELLELDGGGSRRRILPRLMVTLRALWAAGE